MQKKIATIVFVLAITLAMSVCLAACGPMSPQQSSFDGGAYPTSHTMLFGESDLTLLQQAMGDGATQQQKKDAVMALYNTANRSRIETPLSLVIQESDAGIKSASVIMHSFNLRNGDKWYYQLATQVETGNELMNIIFGAFAGYLKVGYCVDDDIYYFGKIGPQFECDCSIATFPYATFVIPDDQNAFETPISPDDFKTTLHYLDSQFELCNMKFCAEIIADDPIITYDAEGKFYRVEFAVDMSADAALLEEWFALPKADVAEGGQELKSYNSFTAILEVWDNGYAKCFETHADRSAGMASGKPVDHYQYVWNEDEILSLLSEDVSIDRAHLEDGAFDNVDGYITYYGNPSLVEAKPLSKLEIVGVAFGGIVGGAILIVIIVIVVLKALVKQGKLPRLAKRLEDKKAKRQAKKGVSNDIISADDTLNAVDSETYDIVDVAGEDVTNDEDDNN